MQLDSTDLDDTKVEEAQVEDAIENIATVYISVCESDLIEGNSHSADKMFDENPQRNLTNSFTPFVPMQLSLYPFGVFLSNNCSSGTNQHLYSLPHLAESVRNLFDTMSDMKVSAKILFGSHNCNWYDTGQVEFLMAPTVEPSDTSVEVIRTDRPGDLRLGEFEAYRSTSGFESPGFTERVIHKETYILAMADASTMLKVNGITNIRTTMEFACFDHMSGKYKCLQFPFDPGSYKLTASSSNYFHVASSKSLVMQSAVKLFTTQSLQPSIHKESFLFFQGYFVCLVQNGFANFHKSNEIRLMPKHVFIRILFDPGESFPPPIQFDRSKIQLDKLLCLPIALSSDVFSLAGTTDSGKLFDDTSCRKTGFQTLPPSPPRQRTKPPFSALILDSFNHVVYSVRLRTRPEKCIDSTIEDGTIVSTHLTLFVKICNQGIGSEQTSLFVILNSVGGLLSANACKQVHALSMKSIFWRDTFDINNLVDSYELDHVAKFFFEYPTLDLLSFTPLITMMTLVFSDRGACSCTCWINWFKFQPNGSSATFQTFRSAFVTAGLDLSYCGISQFTPCDCLAEFIVQFRLLIEEHQIWNPSLVAPVSEILQLVLFVKLGVSIQHSVSRLWLLFHLVFLGKSKVPPDIMFESLIVHLDVTLNFSIVMCCGVIGCGHRSDSNFSTIPLVTHVATMLRKPTNGLALSDYQKGWKSRVQANLLALDTWTTVIQILEQLLEGKFLNTLKVTNYLLVEFHLTYFCDSLLVGHSKEAYTRQWLVKEIVICFVELISREHLVESSPVGKQFPPDAIVLTAGA